MRSPRNVVVVLADQLRRDALGCMGDPNVRTPHIDRLAAEGTTFTAASSTFPACVPFRFSLMTGHYAHSRNVPALGFRLSPAERTLGEAIGALGHATAYIGKWHLYSAYGTTGTQTLRQANRTPVPARYRRGFDHWRGFELRNDYYDTVVFADDDPLPLPLEGYQTDALFELGVDYLKSARPAGRAFFLLLSLEAPHPPFMAPPEAIARVAGRGPLHLRPNIDVPAIDFFPPEWHAAGNPGGAVDPADPHSRARVFAANMNAYYAMIEIIDAGLGRLRATLEETGLAASTTVVLLSDHGELGGSHGLLGKAEPYEESTGIPFIVQGTGPPGRRCALPVCTEDLFPTLVGLAGGHAEPAPGGLDFSAFLQGHAGEPERDGVLLEFVAETRRERAYFDETWRGIRTRHHKYTVLGDRSGARPWQLFELASDPFEQVNRVADPALGATAGELHTALSGLLDKSGDDFALAPAFGHPARSVVPA